MIEISNFACVPSALLVVYAVLLGHAVYVRRERLGGLVGEVPGLV